MAESGKQQWAPDTQVVALGRPAREHDAAVNPPVVFTSTFHGHAAVQPADRAYGRYSNPSWNPLEEALGTLEGANLPGLLYASGLAAAAAALSVIPEGGILVMPRHAYQGALVLAQELADAGRIQLRQVDIANTEQTVAALDGAAMLWLESPTNPMLEVADLPEVLAEFRRLCPNGVSVCDNTFATPLLQRPLELGADVVIHSVTKYLAGHSDVILGAVLTSQAALRDRLAHYRSIHGAIPGPMEAWLALRGLRTLALRMERSQATAGYLAQKLDADPRVGAVRYPGLPTDPGHERAAAQMAGFGAVLCLELATAAHAEAVSAAVQLFTPATSLGGVESLIERRRRHSGEPVSVPEGLLRLSIGIENAQDLWADLSAAIDVALGATR